MPQQPRREERDHRVDIEARGTRDGQHRGIGEDHPPIAEAADQPPIGDRPDILGPGETQRIEPFGIGEGAGGRHAASLTQRSQPVKTAQPWVETLSLSRNSAELTGGEQDRVCSGRFAAPRRAGAARCWHGG